MHYIETFFSYISPNISIYFSFHNMLQGNCVTLENDTKNSLVPTLDIWGTEPAFKSPAS
jgi:hypothetical protein